METFISYSNLLVEIMKRCDKIQMTTPVYMKNEKNKNTMEFVMPSKYDINSISNPNDKDVTIFESEAKYYACISMVATQMTVSSKNIQKIYHKN